MFARHLQAAVETALSDYPAVALLGARQVGKPTLARQIEQLEFLRPAVYLDLERPSDRRKLTDAEAYLSLHSQQLVILDEVQHLPEVFPVLRSLIDEGRRSGPSSGRFLLLGSASGELLHPSGESLAGRIAYLELAPLHTLEVGAQQQNTLWLRGGFPSSLLASSDVKSMDWRRNLISTYLERELPGYGSRLPAQTLRRLWTMLAHLQGGLLDVSQLAKGLMIDTKTVHRYLDMLGDLMLLRKLMPWHSKLGKRLIKSPKLYVRDSGLLHALLGLSSLDALMAHPVVRNSWEGFVIETLIHAAPLDAQHGFYRSSNGAEIDLVIDTPSQGLMAIEVKKSFLARQIAPIEVGEGRHRQVMTTDEFPRPDITLERLRQLKPSFAKDGTVTAGNASGVTDGAAFMVVASADAARARGLHPQARVLDWATVGVDPQLMGIGPVPAVRKRLARTGLSVADIDYFEVNEAFAVVNLHAERELGLPRDRTNLYGGGISVGHPPGATGLRMTMTAMHHLQDVQGHYAIVTMCIGAGQGMAMLIEYLIR